MKTEDKAFRDALEVVLTEFGDCDLEERIKYFEGEDMHDEALNLNAAFRIVEQWLWGKTRYSISMDEYEEICDAKSERRNMPADKSGAEVLREALEADLLKTIKLDPKLSRRL